MLAHLDDIDWSKLEHAYGAATDVPAMLRALDSVEAEERQRALYAAYGNIFHQGTRYSATPKAIPFLVELAAEPAPKDLGELLPLITHCVAGYFSPVGGPRTGSGPIWGEPAEPMSSYGETTAILADCERAAEPAVPLCLRLLDHRDPTIRAQACHLLAALHRFGWPYEVVPRLRELFARESVSSVRAMVAFALTHLLPVADDASLEAIARDDADALVRLVATMGCVRRGGRAPELATALLGWLTDTELDARYTELPFGAAELPGDIGELLTELGAEALRGALPLLVDRLGHVSEPGAEGVLAAALVATFGSAAEAEETDAIGDGDSHDAEEPPPASALTAEQRTVLETLAHNQGFWSNGNALNVLMDYRLPSMREAMAAYLGITVTHDPIEALRIGARMFASFGAEKALEEWQKVLAVAPEDGEALCNAGLFMLQLGEDDDEAIAHLERGLARSVEPSELVGRAAFELGMALHATGENDAALDAWARAEQHLRGAGKDAARQNRVAILQQLGRFEDALALEEQSPPSSAQDHYHRGLALVKAGRYRECIASITRVLADDPDHALAHYTIACAYALSGEPDQALASIARALEIEPELAGDIAGDSDFASLQDDPRFGALVGHGR
jgi:tetratricopeptide (TPR) repeat protein